MFGISQVNETKKRSAHLCVSRLAAALTALVFAIACTACSAGPRDIAKPTDIPSETAAETALMSDTEKALEAYRGVVAKADTYDYGAEPGTETEGYCYALVMMQNGDAVPTLLMAQRTRFGVEYVKAFRYDPETDTVLEPVLPNGEALMQGAGSAGGFRGSLSILEDGGGLAALYFYSGTGEGTLDRISAEGDALSSARLWEGNIEELDGFPTRPIEKWYDTSDASGFEVPVG